MTGKLIDFIASEIDDLLGKNEYLLISVPPMPDVGNMVLFQYSDLIKKHASHIK